MNIQFDYFIKNFQLFYDISDVDLGYGSNHQTIIIERNCDPNFWTKKSDLKSEDIIWKEWNGVNIPFLFDKNDQLEIISINNGQVKINYDIVASTFYFLSGWNEYVSSTKDQFGRVSYKDSIIKNLGISHLPVANYYFSILEEAILLSNKKDIKKSPWGNELVVSLTHDIDNCYSAWIEGSFSEIKKKKFLSIPKLIFKRFFQKDDWFNFNVIAELESKFNAKSSFYFLPQKGKVGKWKNADYNIGNRKIQDAIRFLKVENNEIGVHGSFGSHANTSLFQEDISRINSQPIVGNRFHFLMFDPENTVSILENCNIKYDTTLGFAEQIGFRRGTCYPFYLFNFKKNSISDVIEIPLIAMDTTFTNKNYMGIGQDQAFTEVCKLIDEVEKFKGVFTLLWHNTFFSEYKYTGWKQVYSDILEYCQKKNALLTNGKFVYEKLTS